MSSRLEQTGTPSPTWHRQAIEGSTNISLLCIYKGLPGTITGLTEGAAVAYITVTPVALGDDRGTLGNVSGADRNRPEPLCR